MKLGVLVYIERENEQILMIHRQKEDEHQGFWLAPGGKIEKNEAPMETAIREAKEETGLDLSELKLKALLTFPDYGNSPFGDEWNVFVFYTKTFVGELLETCSEGELCWIPKNQLVTLPMWEGDKLFTPKIFENGCFSAKLSYQNEEFLDAVFW